MQTNIQKYAPAVLLSSKINVYKGEVATNILLVCFPFVWQSNVLTFIRTQGNPQEISFRYPSRPGEQPGRLGQDRRRGAGGPDPEALQDQEGCKRYIIYLFTLIL
jgi:hypothetical protein